MKKEKTLTIKDIAAACGVGIASVSRVVNRKPGVKPDLRMKIQRFIDDLGWQCNSLPLRFSARKNERLIILLSNGTNYQNLSVLHEILKEVLDQAPHAGYGVLILPGNRRNALEQCLNLKPYAVLENSPYPMLEEEREKIIEAGIRYISVATGLVSQGVCFASDWHTIGKRMAKTLRLAGHRSIGCFTGLGERIKISSFEEAVTENQKNFLEGIASAHKEFDAERDIVGDNYGDVRPLMEELKQKRHTAWICDDWKPCALFLTAVYPLGLRIPEDLSLLTIAPDKPDYLFPLPIVRLFPDVRGTAARILEQLNPETTYVPQTLFMDYKQGKGTSVALQNSKNDKSS